MFDMISALTLAVMGTIPFLRNTVELEANVGTRVDAAAAGAVTEVDTLTAYIKQLITAELVALGLRGALDDAADDTTDTATIMGLVRHIAEAINNGTGSAIGADLSLVDLLGAFDGGADPQGDIYQALGVDATNSIKALIDALSAKVPVVVLKSSGDLTAFGTSMNLFTVTGDVYCRVGASVDVAVTSTSGTTTLEAGIPGNTASLLVQDAVDNTAFDIGDSWTLNTPPDTNGGQMADKWLLVGNGATIILTGSVDDITAGEIDFYCEFLPLYSGAGVVAAA